MSPCAGTLRFLFVFEAGADRPLVLINAPAVISPPRGPGEADNALKDDQSHSCHISQPNTQPRADSCPFSDPEPSGNFASLCLCHAGISEGSALNNLPGLLRGEKMHLNSIQNP